LTLRRTPSKHPRTFYSLEAYDIIPLSWLEKLWSNLGNAIDESPVSPKKILADDAAKRKKDGALGSVLVISMELAPGNNRSPREALETYNTHVIQPLGVFDVHKNKLATFPRLPVAYWEDCLKNGLKGGAWARTFVPYVPSD